MFSHVVPLGSPPWKSTKGFCWRVPSSGLGFSTYIWSVEMSPEVVVNGDDVASVDVEGVSLVACLGENAIGTDRCPRYLETATTCILGNGGYPPT